MIPAISQDADDLIIASEVGSRALFEKKYRRPEWPGGASGVTIGIGYDLGYASKEKIRSDWVSHVGSGMLEVMIDCSGITGESARRQTAQVRPLIDITWQHATAVYENVDVPQWVKRVCDAIPGAENLHAHCLGSLTSLAYNRGASFKNAGDRYREMRAIRSHIMAGELSLVDDEIRNMKRLWEGRGLPGLLIRRDKEAALWNLGLSAPAVPLPKSKTKENPEPLAKPQGGGGAAPGSAGTVITTTTAATANAGGVSPLLVGGIIVAGVVITAGAIAYARYRNSQSVLARAKG